MPGRQFRAPAASKAAAFPCIAPARPPRDAMTTTERGGTATRARRKILHRIGLWEAGSRPVARLLAVARFQRNILGA